MKIYWDIVKKTFALLFSPWGYSLYVNDNSRCLQQVPWGINWDSKYFSITFSLIQIGRKLFEPQLQIIWSFFLAKIFYPIGQYFYTKINKNINYFVFNLYIFLEPPLPTHIAPLRIQHSLSDLTSDVTKNGTHNLMWKFPKVAQSFHTKMITQNISNIFTLQCAPPLICSMFLHQNGNMVRPPLN